ncbi:Uncharacterised protein [Legionella spiritensis]|nr:Uncharacterised protein [Legionella spiritensis]
MEVVLVLRFLHQKNVQIGTKFRRQPVNSILTRHQALYTYLLSAAKRRMICPFFVARHEGEAEMREIVHVDAHLFSQVQ